MDNNAVVSKPELFKYENFQPKEEFMESLRREKVEKWWVL